MKPITIYRRTIRTVRKYNPSFDDILFEKAFFYIKKRLRGLKTSTGESYIEHPLRAVYRLSHLKSDDHTLISALLHDALKQNPEDEDYIEETFGVEILRMVKGVIKLDEIKYLEDMDDRQVDALRKMYLSLSSDVRIVLIKIAEKLNLLEFYLDDLDDKEKRFIAKEIMEVYVPITDGLGVWEFKWRLEDLSFKYLKPEAYADLSSEITESKEKMESYIRKVSHIIEKELKNEGLSSYKITGRVKNLYSIYKKIVYKNRSLDEIYDIIAIRILVEDNTDCYRVLGIVHNLWRPLAHRIKDYISVPKMNGYRSLHTTIFCVDNHLTEIQIRTEEMNEEAEYGLAAHMTYGQNKLSLIPTEDQKHWISNLKDIKFTNAGIDEDLEYKKKIKTDIFTDHIYVFTPRGHVKDLPRGATSVDFAYAVHTEMGHNLIGAKINGKMVSLDTTLENGDIVEILVRNDSSGPKREWLSLVKTSKARNKIKIFLKRDERGDNIKIGRESLKKELTKLKKKLTAEDKKTLCKMLPYDNIYDLYAAIGEGGLSNALVIKKLYPGEKKEAKKKVIKIIDQSNPKVSIEGIGATNTRLAKCCSPTVKDKICGYVTIASGISVHKKSCKFIVRVSPDRVLKARWK